MGLFKVRPSRGSWAFFALVALAAASRREWRHHEVAMIHQDGPAVESARAFATCLLGPDVSWVLREDEGVPLQAQWSFRLGSWLSMHLGVPLPREWPGRCLPLLDELTARLPASSRGAAVAVRAAGQVRTTLRRPLVARFDDGAAARTAAWQTELLRLSDDGTLAAQLASLFASVHDLSIGSRDRWSPAPLRLETFPTVPAPQVPTWVSLDPTWTQAVLASPTVLFHRSLADGRTHRVDFDRHVHNDTVLGGVVLWRTAPRGDVLRGSTEGGGALVPIEPSTQPIALPDEPGAPRRGEEFDWQAAANTDGVAWLTLDHGTVQMRVHPSDPTASWTAPQTLGVAGSQLAAVVAPEPLDPLRWRVTALRPRAVDLAVEQYVVALGADGLHASAALERAPLAFPPAQRVLTCGAGSVRYVALLSPSRVAVLRVESDRARVAEAPLAVAWGDDPTLRCDAGRALLASDPATMESPAVIATFPLVQDPSVDLVTPLPYDRGGRPRELLLTDDGLLAIAAHARVLRAWRLPLQAVAWEPAGYLASLAPAPESLRTLRVLQGVSRGRAVALWVEGDAVTRVFTPGAGAAPSGPPRVVETREPFRVIAVSDDGGRSFGIPLVAPPRSRTARSVAPTP